MPYLVIGGTATKDWGVTRKTANYQSNGPVTDITSAAFRCYQLADGSEGAAIANVTAGSTIAIGARASFSHPGNFGAWLSKVPEGQNAAAWTGDGATWVKIYNDKPDITAGGISWPTQSKLDEPLSGVFCFPCCIWQSRSVRALACAMGHEIKTTSLTTPHPPSHRQGDHLVPDPQVHRGRAVPAADGARGAAQRGVCGGRAVLHLVPPDQRQRRDGHVEAEPAGDSGVAVADGPGHHDQHLLPDPQDVHAVGWRAARVLSRRGEREMGRVASWRRSKG